MALKYGLKLKKKLQVSQIPLCIRDSREIFAELYPQFQSRAERKKRTWGLGEREEEMRGEVREKRETHRGWECEP